MRQAKWATVRDHLHGVGLVSTAKKNYENFVGPEFKSLLLHQTKGDFMNNRQLKALEDMRKALSILKEIRKRLDELFIEHEKERASCRE